MGFRKRILKWSLYLLLIPISYLIISLILSSVTIKRKNASQVLKKSIYLTSNGVHLDIVISKNNVDSLLLSGLSIEQSDKYVSFGWGDENFYINTPTWKDLTFKSAFKAVFLKSSTLMHVTRYKSKYSDWIEIKVTESELNKLNFYIQNTFKTDENYFEKSRLFNNGRFL